MNEPEQEPTSQVEAGQNGFIVGLGKDAIFWLAIFYSIALAALAIFGNCSPIVSFGVPDSIAWFGAVGAVMISFQGIFDHREDWDPLFNYWHVARPIVGAGLGAMSFLIFSVIVTLAGSAPPDPAKAPSVANLNIFHVLAFIVGYREQTFRDLLKRVTDLILRPAADPPQKG